MPVASGEIKQLQTGGHTIHSFYIGKVELYKYQEEWLVLSDLLEEDPFPSPS